MTSKLNYKLINLTALMLLLYIGFSNVEVWINVLTKASSILLPFLIAFAFAYALEPVINYLKKKGLKEWMAVLIVVLVVVLVFIGLLIATLPLIYDQLMLLSKNIVEITKEFSKEYNINLAGFNIKITDYIDDATKNIGSFLSTGAIAVLNGSFSFIGSFLVGFIAWIYFLADMDNIRDKIKDVTRTISEKFFNYIKCLDVEIGNYIKGLAIFMVIQFVEYSFLFWLVGHPNWLLLGILACITTVIPYFGGLITNIIGIITASVVSTPLLIGTIIICIVFPQLDGYVISPRIYGKTNNVNPLITIMAVSIGGSLGGILGIIIALPAYLLIRATYHFYHRDFAKSVKNLKKNM